MIRRSPLCPRAGPPGLVVGGPRRPSLRTRDVHWDLQQRSQVAYGAYRATAHGAHLADSLGARGARAASAGCFMLVRGRFEGASLREKRGFFRCARVCACAGCCRALKTRARELLYSHCYVPILLCPMKIRQVPRRISEKPTESRQLARPIQSARSSHLCRLSMSGRPYRRQAHDGRCGTRR